MKNAMPGLPNIFEYENFRTFLQETYEALKARDKKFSFRYFARMCGFSSHSFLQYVMQGQSNISLESAEKVAKAFKLNHEQTTFFLNLVQLNQAKTSEERHHFAKEILKSQTYRRIHPLREAQYHYYAHWYFVVIRELVGLEGFVEDPDWIAAQTIPPIKAEEAKTAIEELLQLGLLSRDGTGKLQQSDPVVTTPSEVSSLYVASWHKQYLQKAADSIDLVSRERRDISAVTLGFSEDTIKVVKEMVEKFRQELVQLAVQQRQADRLYQLNIQVFPLTDPIEKGES